MNSNININNGARREMRRNHEKHARNYLHRLQVQQLGLNKASAAYKRQKWADMNAYYRGDVL